MGKKFNPKYSYESTSDYDYDNANKIIDNPFDSSKFINDTNWVEGDPYDDTLPMLSDNSTDQPTYKSKELPTPNNSIWEDVKSGFMSGLNKADQAIMDMPRTIYKPFSWLSDKILPGYDPKQDMILQGLNKASDYYKNNAQEYDKSIGDSKGSKVAATIAGFVPQAVEMGISLGIPLPKVGSMGKVLDNFGAPIEKNVSGLLNDSKLGEYAGKMAKNSSEFAALNALDTAAQGGNFSDIGKSALEGAGMGALFGAGGKVIGDVFSHFVPGIGKVKPVKEEGNNVIIKDEAGNEVPINKVIFDNTSKAIEQPVREVNYQGSTNMPMPNRVVEMPSIGDINRNVAYNKMELPNMNNSTEIPMPNFRNRQFAENSILNSNVVPKELKSKIEQDMPTYEPITNKETWQKATERVNKDPMQAEKDYWDNNSLRTAGDTALGESLIVKAIKDGDVEKANRLTADLSAKLTEAGQTVQAAAMMKRLTPEGMLMYANKVVNKVNSELEVKLGKDATKAKLTKGDTNKILEGMKRYQELPEGPEKDVALAQVKQIIADKIPATTSEKIKALQRMSLILNPKTLLTRNPLGNTILGGFENIKDIPGTLIDTLTSAIRGSERTTTLPEYGVLRKGQLEGSVKGLKEWNRDRKLGIDTSPTQGQMELPSGRVFNNNVLNSIDQFERKLLQLGDRPFYQAAYEGRLNELKKIKKTDKLTPDTDIEAKMYAMDRVFQNNSALSQKAKQIKNGLGLLGDIVMPFTSTPSNVLDKLIDYSPGGLAKAVYQLGKSGKNFDQKLFVDRAARSLTGTGMGILGYVMASKGLITGKGDDNKRAAQFERAAGKSSYAFKIGDKYYTFDFAQPISGTLAIGADAYFGGKDKKDFISSLTGGLQGGLNTLINQSLFQGVANLLSGYSPAASISKSILGGVTQLTPTSSKQLAQLVDPVTRETYDPNTLKQTVNQLKSRIPFLSETLLPKINVLGQEVKNFDGQNTPYNVFLNPGFTTQEKTSPGIKLLNDLYKETGKSEILPMPVDKNITIKGNKRPLTPQEYNQYQTMLGQESMRKIEELSTSNKEITLKQKVNNKMTTSKKNFNSYTAEEKTKILKNLLDDVNDDVKKKVFGG